MTCETMEADGVLGTTWKKSTQRVVRLLKLIPHRGFGGSGRAKVGLHVIQYGVPVLLVKVTRLGSDTLQTYL